MLNYHFYTFTILLLFFGLLANAQNYSKYEFTANEFIGIRQTNELQSFINNKKKLKRLAKKDPYYELLLSDAYRFGYFNKEGKPNFKKSLDILESLAKKRDTGAIRRLAHMNRKGMGIIRNIKNGISLLEESAKLGDLGSKQDLGMMYYYGIDLKKNYKTALNFLDEPANANRRKAMYFLGKIYSDNNSLIHGVDINLKKAVEWLEKSNMGKEDLNNIQSNFKSLSALRQQDNRYPSFIPEINTTINLNTTDALRIFLEQLQSIEGLIGSNNVQVISNEAVSLCLENMYHNLRKDYLDKSTNTSKKNLLSSKFLNEILNSPNIPLDEQILYSARLEEIILTNFESNPDINNISYFDLLQKRYLDFYNTKNQRFSTEISNRIKDKILNSIRFNEGNPKEILTILNKNIIVKEHYEEVIVSFEKEVIANNFITSIKQVNDPYQQIERITSNKNLIENVYPKFSRKLDENSQKYRSLIVLIYSPKYNLDWLFTENLSGKINIWKKDLSKTEEENFISAINNRQHKLIHSYLLNGYNPSQLKITFSPKSGRNMPLPVNKVAKLNSDNKTLELLDSFISSWPRLANEERKFLSQMSEAKNAIVGDHVSFIEKRMGYVDGAWWSGKVREEKTYKYYGIIYKTHNDNQSFSINLYRKICDSCNKFGAALLGSESGQELNENINKSFTDELTFHGGYSPIQHLIDSDLSKRAFWKEVYKDSNLPNTTNVSVDIHDDSWFGFELEKYKVTLIMKEDLDGNIVYSNEHTEEEENCLLCFSNIYFTGIPFGKYELHYSGTSKSGEPFSGKYKNLNINCRNAMIQINANNTGTIICN